MRCSPLYYRQHKGGYSDITNIDISQVVVDHQKSRVPAQQWMVMDVSKMAFEDGSCPVIIDKSLIDTLLCAPNSSRRVVEMLREVERVLSPGGRFITFSLHSVDEIAPKFEAFHDSWRISSYHVRSNRWNSTEHRKRAVAHSMVICDKVIHDVYPEHTPDLSHLPCVLTDDSYEALKARAEDVNVRAGLRCASTEQLRYLLFQALSSDFAKKPEDDSIVQDIDKVEEFLLAQVLPLEHRLRNWSGSSRGSATTPKGFEF